MVPLIRQVLYRVDDKQLRASDRELVRSERKFQEILAKRARLADRAQDGLLESSKERASRLRDEARAALEAVEANRKLARAMKQVAGIELKGGKFRTGDGRIASNEAIAQARIEGERFLGQERKFTGMMRSISFAAKAAFAGAVVVAVNLARQAIVAAVASAVELERQMVGVAKTTGLGSRELLKLKDDLLAVSRATGIGTDKLTSYAETAGQLGIVGTENILKFTEVAAKLEAVSDLSADDAANALAKISNAFKLPIDQAGALGSVLNELSNTTPATAADVADGLQRVGGAGASIGLTVDQVAGLQATLVGAGIESQRAGTALKNVFIRMQTQAKETGEILGLSASEFSAQLEAEAMPTLLQFLERLREMPQAAKAATIKDLFGDESYLQVLTLVDGIETLNTNLATSETAFGEAKSLNEEFAVSLRSVGAQYDVAKARVAAFTVGIGERLLPAAGAALNAFNRMTNSAADFAAEVATLQTQIDDDRAVLEAIDVYERLADKQNRTRSESEQLRSALDLMQRQRPGFVAAVNAQGQATRVFASAMRDATQAAIAMAAATQLRNLGEVVEDYGDATSRYDRARDRRQSYVSRYDAGERRFTVGGPNGSDVMIRDRISQYGDAMNQASLDATAAALAMAQTTQTLIDSGRSVDEAIEMVTSTARGVGVNLSAMEQDTLRNRVQAAPPPAPPPAAPPAGDADSILGSEVRSSLGAASGTSEAAAAREREDARKAELKAAAELQERLRELRGVTVTANRLMTAQEAEDRIAMNRELVARQRVLADEEVSQIADASERRRRSAEVAIVYAEKQRDLALDLVDVEQAAADAEADAARDTAKARAESIKNATEKAAAIEAAEAVHTQSVLANERAATIERRRINTQFIRDRISALEPLREAERGVAEAVAAAVKQIEEMAAAEPPDLGATLSLEAVEEFEEGIREARAQLHAGEIDQRRFNERVEELRGGAAAALQKIAQELLAAGLITKEAADEMERLAAASGETGETKFDKQNAALSEAVKIAEDLAFILEGIGVDGAGTWTQAAAGFAEGGLKLGQGIATGDPKAMAEGAIKLAKTGVELYGALSAQREATARNREALEDAEQATRENTAAILSGRVGEDVTLDGLEAVERGFQEVIDSLGGIRVGAFGGGWSEARDAMEDYLDSLDAAGIDTRDLRAQFAAAMELGGREGRDALYDLMEDIRERFDGVAEGFGSYSDDLNGAFDELRDRMDILGLEGLEALRFFVDRLGSVSEDLGDFGDGLNGLDLNDPEAVREYVERIFEESADPDSGFDFGDLSPAELQELLLELLALAESGGAGEEDGDSVTDGVATVRNLSETTGNVIAGYLQEILRVMREQLALALRSLDGAAPGSTSSRGDTNIVVNLSVQDEEDAVSKTTAAVRDGFRRSRRV